jgi:hypothetical protein
LIRGSLSIKLRLIILKCLDTIDGVFQFLLFLIGYLRVPPQGGFLIQDRISVVKVFGQLSIVFIRLFHGVATVWKFQGFQFFEFLLELCMTAFKILRPFLGFNDIGVLGRRLW